MNPHTSKQNERRATGLAIVRTAALLLSGSGLLIGCGDGLDTASRAAAVESAPPRNNLVAMARLEPASQVINLAPAISDVVTEILVEEGESVTAGQELVRFESFALRAAERDAARLELEQVALTPFDIEAQASRIRSIEAELEYARNDVGSQQDLSEKGFTAGVEYQNARLRVRRAEEQLNEARAMLKSLEAGMELSQRKAENQLQVAESRLAQTLLRSPIDGQILKLLVRPGELVGNRPVLKLGQTDEMVAIAEVHANDIRLVRKGQRATFTSAALPEPISGVVDQIGSMIYKNDVFGEDPTAPRGLRVIQVRVRLEDDPLAAHLTNLEGQIRIDLASSRAG